MPAEDPGRRYSLYGVGVGVSSNHPGLAAALHARLQYFSTEDPAAPALTFEFRCGPSANGDGLARPPGTWRPVYDPPLGQVVYSDQRDEVHIDVDGRVRVLSRPSGGRTQVCVPRPEASSLWLASHPVFTLPLVEHLKRRGLFSLHAGGLCVEGKGLLLIGASGCGKTTLTLALLRAGFGFLSDDLVFLTQDEARGGLSPSAAGPGLRMLAFPEEIDVTEETARRFPELQPLLAQPGSPGRAKRQFMPQSLYGVTPVPWCRPEVLVFPRVTPEAESRLERITADEALLRLAPNVLLTEARSAQAHLDILARLARETRCYRLDSGRGLEQLPARFLDLMAAEGSEPV